MKNRIGERMRKNLTKALFIVYMIALVWILLLKLGVQFSYMAERRVNLIPFRELFLSNGNITIGESVLNVVVFVPLGIYVGVLLNTWRFANKIFLFFLISLLFEGLQFILKIGSFDSTDLITNTLGGLVGLVLFKAIEKVFKDRIKAHKFINIISIIATVSMTSLLVMLKMNMLPIMYR